MKALVEKIHKKKRGLGEVQKLEVYKSFDELIITIKTLEETGTRIQMDKENALKLATQILKFYGEN